MHPPHVIFGAGIVGQLVLRELQAAGLASEILCFCDNNPTKKSFAGLPVLLPAAVKEKYPDAVFYLAACDMDDAVRQLRSLGFQQWVSLPQIQQRIGEEFNPVKWTWEVPLDAVQHTLTSAYWCHQYHEKGDYFLHSVDIMVTTRCSLRCRDCCNLMPMHQQPENFSPQKIFGDIDRLLASTALVEARVIGGEPLMHPEFHHVVKYLAEQKKVKKVVVYTNGTIPLRDEQVPALRHAKVFFMITDYGKLSRNLNQQVSLLKHFRIPHWVMPAGGWTDCGRVAKHNRTPEGNKKVFSACCVKNCYTLLDGKLYRCPFAANVQRLKLFPALVDDGAALERKAIVALREKEYLDACDYCSGRPRGAPEIIPAIQKEL